MTVSSGDLMLQSVLDRAFPLKTESRKCSKLLFLRTSYPKTGSHFSGSSLVSEFCSCFNCTHFLGNLFLNFFKLRHRITYI